MLIDSHCHLGGKAFDADRDAVLEAGRGAGVEAFLTVGTGDGPPDLAAAVRLSDAYRDVYATVGVHPHDAAKARDGYLDELRRLSENPKVLAIGEIGFDYHYDFSPRETQKRVFVEQLALAEELRKPIIIHTREAWGDTLDMLRAHWAPTGLGGVMHCFSGNTEQALAALELGFHISFAGMLTFRRSDELRETAKRVPAERLLVETDSPYLTPEPHRKIRRNEPRFVVETAKRLAEVRGEDFEALAGQTTANFHNLFGLRGSE